MTTAVLRRLAFAGACLALASTAHATPLRADLGTLGGEETWARDMNDRGQVVGCSQIATGEMHAFIWDLEHGMVDLGIDAPESCAIAINGAGQVVGGASDATWSSGWAFLWEGGQVTSLGDGWGAALNDVGQVLGLPTYDWDGVNVGWVWQDGVRRSLPQPFPGTFEPVAINDAGRVVGYLCSGACRAIVHDVSSAGIQTTLLSLGGQHEMAAALNELGQVVVQSYTQPAPNLPGVDSLFLWSDGGSIPLGTLGGHSSVAAWSWPLRSLNCRGEVVGGSRAADDSSHGFLWSGGQMFDLGDRVFPSAINEAGQFIGQHPVTPGGWMAFLNDHGVMTDLGYPGLSSVGKVINERGEVLVSYQDAGTHQRALAWFPSAPEEVAAVGSVATALASVDARGDLPRNTVSALDATLDAAASRAVAGDGCAAARVLGAFRNKVEALVRSGRLGASSAQLLLDAAEESIAALGAAC